MKDYLFAIIFSIILFILSISLTVVIINSGMPLWLKIILLR